MGDQLKRWGRLTIEGLQKGQSVSELEGMELIKPGHMTDLFRGWPDADELMVREIREKGLTMGCPEEKLQPGFQERLIEFTGTDETVDRMGDIIKVDGWNFEQYRRNPVFMPWHDYRTAPVGQALDVYVDQVRAKGASKMRKRVRFVILFATEEENPLAETMLQLYRGGFMRATSVGFRPTSARRPEEDEADELGMPSMGIIYEAQELLELSGVSVPANPNALAEAGYEVSEEDRKEVEMLADKTHEFEPEFAIQLRAAIRPAKSTADLGSIEGFQKVRELLERKAEPKVEDPTHDEPPTIEEPKGAIPGDPPGASNAPDGTPWKAPSAKDFGVDGDFGEESAAERRRIARHYAWTEKNPPETFAQLKLPHHRPADGYRVFRGVAGSMGALFGARGGVKVPDGDRRKIYNHLARHYRQFEREPPPFKAVEDQVLKGSEQTSPDVWEVHTSGEAVQTSVVRFNEVDGELHTKVNGEWQLLTATEDDLKGLDTEELTVEVTGMSALYEHTASIIASIARAGVETMISAQREGDEEIKKAAAHGLHKLFTELGKMRTSIEVAVGEPNPEDPEAEEVRGALEALAKQQVSVQALKFPKKIWRHEEAVRVFAEQNGLIADDIELREGSFFVPQRKATAFTDLREFCLSPGGAEPDSSCRIAAVGGALKSYEQLAIAELCDSVVEGFGSLEVVLDSLVEGLGPGGRGAPAPKAPVRKPNGEDDIYGDLLNVASAMKAKFPIETKE